MDTLILLHGIGRSARNMAGLADSARKRGYEVHNLDYPSRQKSLQDLSVWLHDYMQDKVLSCTSGKTTPHKIHFVTHSMGGLVLAQYLKTYQDHFQEKPFCDLHPLKKPVIGRVVMLSPPLGGSEVADFLSSFWLYRAWYGPAGMELLTRVRAPATYQSEFSSCIWYDLGIIAGSNDRPYPLARFLLNPPSDGRVRVVHTKIKEMRDHIVLPVTHSFMMHNPQVHTMCFAFLQTGQFPPRT